MTRGPMMMQCPYCIGGVRQALMVCDRPHVFGKACYQCGGANVFQTEVDCEACEGLGLIQIHLFGDLLETAESWPSQPTDLIDDFSDDD